LQKDKLTFKLEGLPLEAFAESLGLPGAPKVKFLSKEMGKQRKNASRQVQAALAEASSSEDEGSGSAAEETEKVAVSSILF
jgi:ATP-dependent RNA helicase DDX10/DBP4